MPILPSRIQDLLDFMDSHGSIWNANAAALGLTVSQGNAVKLGAGAARTKFAAQLAAAQAAKVATNDAHDAAATMRTAFADALKTIKAFALTQADPNTVYNLAQIPAPAAAAPVPPPGVPTEITASLANDGSVVLKWKAANPAGSSGVVWTIKRKLEAEQSFTFAGASGIRSFTDASIPWGQTRVQYMIFGQRGQSVGSPCAAFTVQFGSGAGGQTIAAQFSEPSGGVRLAA
jgi:hypothetical protein